MVDIPRLHLLDDGDEESQEAPSLGLRTLRESGGSVVVTIPPEVLDLTSMAAGDDVVIHASEDSISLTQLPEQSQAE